VGPARARALADAGYRTVRDLLFHLPQRYEDRSAVLAIAGIAPGSSLTLRGRLAGVRILRTRRRISIVRATLDDGTGKLPVSWFNRPYLASQVLEGPKYLLHGKVREKKGGIELLNPSVELAERAFLGAGITPVYPPAGSVGPAAVRRILDVVLAGLDPAERIDEPLPADLLARYGLPPLGEALRELHRPSGSASELLNRRRSPAWLRVIYGELLELQLALALLRALEEAAPRTRTYRIDRRLRKAVREVLPFPLTGAQERAFEEVLDDLRVSRPMVRLLQGDVGSGKTIVAALALAAALENGYQGAFMAPTEILAGPHAANLRALLGDR